MKAQQQLIITINNSLNGYQKKEQQILQWLQKVTPAIIKKQKMVADELYLDIFQNSVSFCLS
jgi:hypothetical protein